MKSRIFTLFKYLFGWPFSALALIFIIKLILPEMPVILSHLKQANFLFLITGLLSFLLFYLLRSYIWYRLLRNYSYEISFNDSCFLWATSEIKRYIPGSIWALFGRTVLFSKKGVTKKDIGVCLIFEAEIFVFSALIVSVLALPFITAHFLPKVIAPIAIILIFLGTLVYIFNRRLFTRSFGKAQKITHFLFPPLPATEIIFLLFISCLSLLFFGFGYFITIASIQFINPQLTFTLSGFFVLSLFIGYLSLLTPAGFGVREAVMIGGLTKFTSFTMSAFLSLFSRIVLIVSEVIFVALAYLWHKARNQKITTIQKWVTHHKQEFILCFLFLLYISYFIPITFLRYDNFYAGRFDLGNMAQTVWNTSRGRIFVLTDPNGTDMVSRLAFHADFLLIFLAPFYALWSNPKMLLLIQTLVVAAGCFFVYFLAKNIIKNKNIALVFAFSYLINPSIERANLFDFHAVTLATTFLLGAYYFLHKKKYWLFLLFAVLAALCKEQIWVIVGLFGFILFIWHKKRVLGLLLFLSSITIFYYLISHAIPQALGSQHFALTYYSDFGDSPGKIIKTILFSPLKTFGTILKPDRLHYLWQLFSPLGFLSLMYPFILIFIGPDLAIDLLSNNAQLHQIFYDYTATISPFLFIAAIYGVVVLRRIPLLKFWNNFPTILIIYLLITALSAAYVDSPLPGAISPNLAMITKPVENGEYIDSFLAAIPRGYSVAASNNIGSHLSERQRIYTLPLGVDQADYLIFLLTDSEYPPSLAAEKQLVERLRKDKKYEIIIEQGPFIVFKKIRLLTERN